MIKYPIAWAELLLIKILNYTFVTMFLEKDPLHTYFVCVCVCVRERERERERLPNRQVNNIATKNADQHKLSQWRFLIYHFLSTNFININVKIQNALISGLLHHLRMYSTQNVAISGDRRLNFTNYSLGLCYVCEEFDESSTLLNFTPKKLTLKVA